MKLTEIGEKKLVRDLTSLYTPNPCLVGGFGHDSAILDIALSSDEYLLMNTDRSGMNIAYKLGLADASCVGDFAVSHAVSDIYASGGRPVAISIALLLPPTLSENTVKEITIGADLAAKKYGAFIASGDTKHSDKFAMVVTVLGKAKRSNILTRSGAKTGDYLVSVGNFGTMLSGLITIKKNLKISERDRFEFSKAICYQNPPYKFSELLFECHLADACMDNSDGLAGTLYALCEKSGVGVLLDESKIPMSDSVKNVAGMLGVNPFQLCLGSGDWQHIYAVPKENLDKFVCLAKSVNQTVAVIGIFDDTKQVNIKTDSGVYELLCLENDRFGVGGTAWFDLLSSEICYLGTKR